MAGSGRELFHAAHYNVLAKRIRELRTTCDADEAREKHGISSTVFHQCIGAQLALDALCMHLGIWFAEDNPRFDKAQWYEATNTSSMLEGN